MALTEITAANSIAYIIPLVPSQNQEFDISLASVTYHLRFKWNYFSNCWVLDIEDASKNPILGGVPLVTGCDLLEQFSYLGIGGALVVQSTTDPDLVPNFSSLGETGNLFFFIFQAPT